MTSIASRIALNCARVRQRIDAACRRAGRDSADVRLVAVTKSAEWEWIEALAANGIHDLGESRPQQLLERAGRFDGGIRWHLIGPLQRNKVRKVLPVAAWIHSVAAIGLLEKIDQVASEQALRPRVLLEVNVSGERSKHGFSPDELLSGWPAVAARARLEIAGLMTMAPFSSDPEQARPVFAGLRALRDRLNSLGGPPLSELSMGMSGDFEPAVEEGSTMVRIGTSLFEGL